jgi:hypothetical protein
MSAQLEPVAVESDFVDLSAIARHLVAQRREARLNEARHTMARRIASEPCEVIADAWPPDFRSISDGDA